MADLFNIRQKLKGSKRARRRAKKAGKPGSSNLAASPESHVFLNVDRSRYTIFAVCVGIIFFLVFAAHTITIWGQFVYLDLYNLSEIRHTRNWEVFWSDLALNALANPLNEPLVKLSLAIDVLSMGIRSPGIFHAIQMLLHFANSLLIFLLVRRIATYTELESKFSVPPEIFGLAASAIFACHPLACGAISYISSRSALLVVLNYLISLNFFISGFMAKEIKPALYLYGLSYFFVICGIWSGPQAVTIPSAFIVTALLMKPSKTTFKDWVSERPFEFFAQLLVAIAVPLILLIGFNPLVGTGFGLKTLPMLDYIATQFKGLATYVLRCFVVPYGISLDPPYVISKSLADPLTILGIALVVGAAFLAYKLRNEMIPSLALTLFVLSLFPSCFVPHPEYVSITRIYLTMASLSILTGYYIARFSALKPILTIIVSVLVAISLVGLSNYRNYEWHKDVRLWKSALQFNPNSRRSISMYAWALSSRDDLEKGFDLAKEAYKSDKDNVILDLILGLYYLEDKKYKEANKYFKAGVKLAEDNKLSEEILYKLESGYARTALKLNDYETALEYADRAIRIHKSAILYYIQGVCYLAQDNPHGAFMKLQESYLRDRLNPDLVVPLTQAAIGCGTKKLQDLGYNMSKRALKVHGNVPDMILLRSYAALETGRVKEALSYINIYLESGKPSAKSAYILYGINKKLGKKQTADAHLKVALAKNPNIRKEMRLYLNRDIQEEKKKKSKKKSSKSTDKSAMKSSKNKSEAKTKPKEEPRKEKQKS